MNKNSLPLARLICVATLATGVLAQGQPESYSHDKAASFQPAVTKFTQKLDAQNRDNLRQAMQPSGKMKALAGLREASADDTVRGVPLQETFLNFNGHSTFIPKGAVINLPKNLESRISDTPEGSLIPFTEFLRKNPAWIMTFEMPLKVVKGEEKVASAKRDFIQKSGRIIISTHDKSPVALQN